MKKINATIREQIFMESANKEEFVSKLVEKQIKESSAIVYYYTLCKKHGIENNAKRGRKPSTINYKDAYRKLVEKIKEEEAKAKAQKKSTGIYKQLLENTIEE